VSLGAGDRIIVVGGGPVGAVLAIVLARRGFAVDVFERRPDPRTVASESPRSSLNLALGERGVACLDELGLGDAVRALGVRMVGRAIHSGAEETTFQPYGNRGEGLLCAKRRDIHCVLLDRAAAEPRVRLRFEHACLRVDLDAPGVDVRAPSGAVARHAGRPVFGADGVNSVVRAAFEGRSWFAGGRRPLAQGYRELVAASADEAPWTADRDVLHVWPFGRAFLLAFPNRDGSFTLSLHLPLGASGRAATEVADGLEAVFPTRGAAARVGEGLLGKPPNPIVTVECRPWTYGGSVSLLGDAAHAVAPYLGQGLSASLEGCLAVGRLLDAHGDWTATLAEFGETREPEVAVFARLSREHFAELGTGVSDPPTLLRRRVEQALNAVSPAGFATLHFLVCFTTVPYTRAVAILRKQAAVVDELLAAIGGDEPSDDELRALAAAHVDAAALEPVAY
jgi:kynurenine 3-monooxygenase